MRSDDIRIGIASVFIRHAKFSLIESGVLNSAWMFLVCELSFHVVLFGGIIHIWIITIPFSDLGTHFKNL